MKGEFNLVQFKEGGMRWVTWISKRHMSTASASVGACLWHALMRISANLSMW